MMSSQLPAEALPKLDVFPPRRSTKRSQRRLVLWAVSGFLLLLASLFMQDAVQNNSPLGLLFGVSWIATILINFTFVDYLLR